MRELVPGVRLLGPADYRRMRWKNGRGWTTEITVQPADAGLNGKPFDWRVSLGEVESDGEFSPFPGYDRSILLTQGAGMELGFDAGLPQRIVEPYIPLSFRGEWRTHCRLLDGPVSDFNVMTLRAKFRHRLEIITTSKRLFTWQMQSETLLIYCFRHAFVLQGLPSVSPELKARDTLILEKREDDSNLLPAGIAVRTTNGVAAMIHIDR